MKILFLDGYFLPERTGITHLEDDLMRGLIDAGYEIVVVTPTPSRGLSAEKIKEYKKKKVEYFYDGKVKVFRVSVPKEGRNKILRALRFFILNIKEYWVAKKFKDIDLIFSYTSPPTQGLIARLLKKRYKKSLKKDIPFLFSVQDMFPESLVTINLTKKKGLLFKYGEHLQKKMYNSADKIVTLGERFKNRVKEYGINENKIEVIENWIDTNEIKLIEKKDNVLYDELGIDRTQNVVLYAGNVGPSRPVDMVFDLAEKFKDNKNIVFVIIGGGIDFLKTQKQAEGHKNVIVHPYFDSNKIASVYSLGDVSLCIGAKYDGFVGFPSKTYNILACNKPVLALYSKNCDFSGTVLSLNAGIVIEQKDIDLFADAITTILNDKEKYSNINERKYVLENASRDVCVKKYVDCVNNLLNNKGNKSADNKV